MCRRIFVFFFWFITLLLLLPFTRFNGVAANDYLPYNLEQSNTIPTMAYDGVISPDWENLSFSTIPPATGTGYFQVSDMANKAGMKTGDLINQIGYNPSRSWQVGTPIENILKLGDFRANSTLTDWSLSTISQYVDFDWDNLRLADFGILKKESLEDIVEAVPYLGDYSLSEVVPLYDLIKEHFGANQATELANLKLGELSDVVEWGTVPIDELDLTQYDLASIPNIENARFGSFINWEGSFISEVPGLSQVPIASFMLGVVQGGFLGKLDIVFGEKEANRTKTISGSYKDGFNVPCEQPNCAHIELTDAISNPTRPLHGKQWISGNSQQVSGGSGLLGSVFGDKEPTGRHPFGDAFKVVLTNTNESEGRAKFSVYFRVCASLFFGGKTCSPYIIGPFPWFSHQEKDLIFVGIDGVEAEVPEGLPPVPTVSSIPPEIADKLPPDLNIDGDTTDYGDLGDFDFGNPNNDDCKTYKGIQLGALRQAIANIESRGSGGYKAVGIHVSADNGTNHGRALGKYQFMSYREDVEAIFRRKSGGMDLLKRIEKNTVSVAEIKRVLLDYFPPEKQEELRFIWVKDLINSGYGKGLRGDALIEQIGSWYSAGEGGSDPTYGSKLVREYTRELRNSQRQCSQTSECTGEYIQPTQGILTSRFKAPNRPNHNGIDVANQVGTPLVAIDGATVKKTYNGCPTWGKGRGDRCGTPGFQGYGNIVLLKLCNGWEILYAHNQKGSLKVNVGQKVSKGEVLANLGSAGSSTGPHLHFEIRTNNGTTPEDPLKYIPKY